MYDEYPHVVALQEYVEVQDKYGNVLKQDWTDGEAIQCFIDTPSAKEQYNAMQINSRLDCYMYYPYRTDLKKGMQLRYEGELYEINRKPEDQGGMHEIMRASLAEVTS